MLINRLLLFLLFSFSFNDYLLFYLSFECSLIPILFLILGWGYQPERSIAGLYLIFYTLFASLPLLLFIFIKSHSSVNSMLLNKWIRFNCRGILSLIIIGAFLVKFPMYITHLWLPKAHVEAPVAGSIILAGILLKLGGYGMIRFLPLINIFPNKLQNLLVVLSLWGGILVSLNCLNLTDIKSLIACSSVVHIRTCIASLLIINDWGLKGAILIIIAHGLCRSGLFYLVSVVYERTARRSLAVNKGLINLIPAIRLWWFLILSRNISAPPTINLIREINIIIRIISWRDQIIFPLFLITFFRASYRIYLFSLRQHGKYSDIYQNTRSGLLIEYLISVLHWAPLNLLILRVFFIICYFSL